MFPSRLLPSHKLFSNIHSFIRVSRLKPPQQIPNFQIQKTKRIKAPIKNLSKALINHHPFLSPKFHLTTFNKLHNSSSFFKVEFSIIINNKFRLTKVQVITSKDPISLYLFNKDPLSSSKQSIYSKSFLYKDLHSDHIIPHIDLLSDIHHNTYPFFSKLRKKSEFSVAYHGLEKHISVSRLKNIQYRM